MTDKEQTQVLTPDQVVHWCDLIQRQIGGQHAGSKRCGHYLHFIGGTKCELGCTRRKGHGDKHRIRIRVIGKRGRKHFSWPTTKYTVAVVMAE